MAGLQKHRIWLIVAAFGAVLVVAITLFRPETDGGPEDPHANKAQSASTIRTGTDPTGTDPAALTETDTIDPSASDPTALATNNPERTPLRAAGVPFGGRVTDASTSRPVTSFTVLLEKVSREKGLEEIIREKIDDEDGRFAFTVESWGDYRLTVHSMNHCPYEGRTHTVPPDTGKKDLQIALDPGYRITGRVVDDETGEPLPGAVAGMVRFNNLYHVLPSGFPEGSNYATTDAQGRFSVGGVKPDPKWHMPDQVVVGASHPDYAVATRTINPAESGPIEFRLEKGFCAFGRVRDDEGRSVAGICVSLGDGMTILHRRAYTDEDGRYRTGPALPGTIFLNAHDPEYLGSRIRRFTAEEKQTEIVDGDVQVDFGPLPGHLTWSGTLFGLDGEPLPEVRIKLMRAKAPDRGRGARELGKAETDDAGRFEFRKIFPETFRALVYLSDERRTVSGGEFAFEEPGRVEQDIHLNRVGGMVSGAVFDKTTGFRLTESLSVLAGNAVQARSDIQNDRTQFAEVSRRDGTFCFSALPAGTYTFHYPWADTIRGIEVADGARIDGLELFVNPTGELRLKMEGFSDRERTSLEINVRAKSGSERNIARPDRDKDALLTHRFREGDYLLRYTSVQLGEGHARFTITHGLITDLTIRRDEMLPHAVDIEVRGRVTLPGGAPAASATLTFESRFWKRGFSRKVENTATCDEEGVFALSGLRSGLWVVRCSTTEGSVLYFKNVVIPPGVESPYSLDLTVPGGCVCGTLIDGATDSLVDSGDVDWLVRVSNSGGWDYPAGLSRSGKGLFRLEGVPEGSYSLLAWVPGYEFYRSSLFEVRDGRTVDVGNVSLTPSGYLDLEVVDRSGLPVEHSTIYCDGKKIGIYEEKHRRMTPNRWLFYDLPTGKVLIRVEPRRCDPAEKEVVLTPGVRTPLRIEVSRK